MAALTMAMIGLIVLLDEFLWRLTLILWAGATIILLVHRARSRRANFE